MNLGQRKRYSVDLLPQDAKLADFQVEWWPISRPKPYPKNARQWTQAAVEKVAASIREFGWRQPIVCDADDVIIIGHLRLAGGNFLEETHVPVHVARDLSPAQVKALRIADNRLHEEAAWDGALLKAEFLELESLELSDLSLTGFEQHQIDALLRGVAAEYAGMPHFEQKNLMPWATLKVHFRKAEDRRSFAEMIGQPLTENTKFVWHPAAEPGTNMDYAWAADDGKNPRYPVYVISKSRWESRLTVKALEAMGVPYRLVVEPQEFSAYAAVVDPAKILQLPFSDLGQGSIPARNWCWEDAIERGSARHWILDDNIDGFYRLMDNRKKIVKTGAMFRAIEDFAERYTNVALAGPNYQWLAKEKQKIPAIVTNTRVYSCILIKNDLPYRWRGRYNEDTDLSLRVLKDGWCTVQFNCFLSKKAATMTMKGGNTDQLYQGDGRLKMAQSLQAQHPDVVTITKKWNRYQHQVDYRRFRNNKFVLREGVVIPEGEDEYGMSLLPNEA